MHFEPTRKLSRFCSSFLALNSCSQRRDNPPILKFSWIFRNDLLTDTEAASKSASKDEEDPEAPYDVNKALLAVFATLSLLTAFILVLLSGFLLVQKRKRDKLATLLHVEPTESTWEQSRLSNSRVSEASQRPEKTQKSDKSKKATKGVLGKLKEGTMKPDKKKTTPQVVQDDHQYDNMSFMKSVG
ncbi:hypothetical protein L596_017351 [Steinernema carpocapsae]|uniref:Uncharacterized protein n=1 Tax=Steinernema carpocapsae TaxID=34508 RepID=A0A4U5N1D8_STECR|nr:hypothetical protein L596_017351 [Steinernema carpocapsae]